MIAEADGLDRATDRDLDLARLGRHAHLRAVQLLLGSLKALVRRVIDVRPRGERDVADLVDAGAERVVDLPDDEVDAVEDAPG
ncbi:MAG: hypothetical protein R6T90_01655, partial [Dissulfuribacterales bacterium]